MIKYKFTYINTWVIPPEWDILHGNHCNVDNNKDRKGEHHLKDVVVVMMREHSVEWYVVPHAPEDCYESPGKEEHSFKHFSILL